MTDGDAWEAHCAAQDGPPFVCHECGAAFDPSDGGEIEAHRDEHHAEWLRSQCPIPPPEPVIWKPVMMTEETEDVPF